MDSDDTSRPVTASTVRAHRVLSGRTLQEEGRIYGVSAAQISRAENGLTAIPAVRFGRAWEALAVGHSPGPQNPRLIAVTCPPGGPIRVLHDRANSVIGVYSKRWQDGIWLAGVLEALGVPDAGVVGVRNSVLEGLKVTLGVRELRLDLGSDPRRRRELYIAELLTQGFPSHPVVGSGEGSVEPAVEAVR